MTLRATGDPNLGRGAAEQAGMCSDLPPRREDQGRPADVGQAGSPFRREALEASSREAMTGRVLRIEPRWLEWSYQLLAMCLGGAFLAAAVVPVPRYAEGRAALVNRLVEVRTEAAGYFSDPLVGMDEHVREGQLIGRVHGEGDARMRAQLELTYQEALRNLLFEPDSEVQATRVATARERLLQHDVFAEEHAIRAPADGVVRGVRARSGEYMAIGDAAFSFEPDRHAGEAADVCVAFPADVGALIRPGQVLRLEFDSLPRRYLVVTVVQVADEVLPTEALRWCGGLADELGGTPVIEVLGAVRRGPGHPQENVELPHRSRAVARARLQAHSLLWYLTPDLRELGDAE